MVFSFRLLLSLLYGVQNCQWPIKLISVYLSSLIIQATQILMKLETSVFLQLKIKAEVKKWKSGAVEPHLIPDLNCNESWLLWVGPGGWNPKPFCCWLFQVTWTLWQPHEFFRFNVKLGQVTAKRSRTNFNPKTCYQDSELCYLDSRVCPWHKQRPVCRLCLTVWNTLVNNPLVDFK